MADQTQGYGAVIATGITAQVVGGAAAIVFVWFFHMAHPTEAQPPEAVEQALGQIFSTFVSTLAMFAHLLVRKFFPQN